MVLNANRNGIYTQTHTHCFICIFPQCLASHRKYIIDYSYKQTFNNLQFYVFRLKCSDCKKNKNKKLWVKCCFIILDYV